MDRDLRDTPLYREVEEFLRRLHEPVFGKISGAADPRPSPDGTHIAFTGSTLEKLEGEALPRICLVPAEGGEIQQLTFGPNEDRSPRWSPDGARLAFLSDRAEKGLSQLYLLERDRLGEALPTPKIDGRVEYVEWSPDGESILLGVAERGAALAGVQGSGATKTKESDEDLPDWVPQAKSTADPEGWRRVWIFDLASGEVRPASREGLNVWEATWCGPARMAAIVSDSPGEEAWYEAPLALIDVPTGQERILYRAPEVQLGLPAASPSGGHLAVLQAICSDRMVIAGDLLLIDLETGRSTPIETKGVDVTAVAWRDDGRLCFTGLRGMDVVIGEHDLQTGAIREVWTTPENTGDLYPEIAPTGDDAFAVTLDSYRRYPSVALVRDGTATVLASLDHEGGRYLREVGGTLERVGWEAPDGLEIEGLLATPPGSGPHPLVVRVHGGPIAAYTDAWYWQHPLTPFLVSRGYAVLHPNPRGSTGRGQKFAEMVYGDMGGGDAQDILAGVDAMIERGIADPARIGVTGGSYGGFMACWLVTQTTRFAAAVAVSPVTDWYSQHLTSNIGFWDRLILKDVIGTPAGEYFHRSPIVFAGQARTPTLLTAGEVDECTPPGQAVEFFEALRENGVEAELALYPGEGHGVRKLPAKIDFYARLTAWFERHMPPRVAAAGGDGER